MTAGQPFQHVSDAMAALAIIPVLGVIGRVALGRLWPRLGRGMAWVCLLFLLASSGLVAGDVGFVAKPLNVAWFLAGYMAYCVLAASAWTLPPAGWGRALGAVLCLPIALMYAALTIGAIGTVLVLADALGSPTSEQTFGALTCRVEDWGAAMTSSGYSVALYRDVPTLRFLHRQVARFTVDQTAGDHELSCAEAITRSHANTAP